MKIVVFTLSLALLVLGPLCADYTVETVSGKVEREVTPGAWEAVKTGDILSPATVVNTKLGAKLVLNDGAKSYSIKQAKKGAVEFLISNGDATEVQVGGTVSAANTSISTRGTANIATASTRASKSAMPDEEDDPEAVEGEAGPPTPASATP